MSKLLRAIVAAGLIAGATLAALGVLANRFPGLDIINNGLPVLALASIALLALAFATRVRALIGAAAVLLAAIFALLLTGLAGAAPEAPDGAARFLRVATFNLWGGNNHADAIMRFVDETGADVLVLQEVRDHHAALLEALSKTYPHRRGESGLAILSKHPILADGRIDRASQPHWMSLIIRWVRLDVAGKEVELAGVHLARPFYADLERGDIMSLITFVQGRTGPLIVAGDFNMTPWTVKLKRFTEATRLGRFNTFYPTWPMRWRNVPLLPFVPIDNVFASAHFAKIDAKVGPRLGSDHRPVIADIALSD